MKYWARSLRPSIHFVGLLIVHARLKSASADWTKAEREHTPEESPSYLQTCVTLNNEGLSKAPNHWKAHCSLCNELFNGEETSNFRCYQFKIWTSSMFYKEKCILNWEHPELWFSSSSTISFLGLCTWKFETCQCFVLFHLCTWTYEIFIYIWVYEMKVEIKYLKLKTLLCVQMTLSSLKLMPRPKRL